jgi:hypothetical protein
MALIINNSFVFIYLLQACTYGAAAALSRRGDHRSLTACYLASALFHGLLGTCHLMHVG